MTKYDGFGVGPSYNPGEAPYEPRLVGSEKKKMVVKIGSMGDPRIIIQRCASSMLPSVPSEGHLWEAFPYTPNPFRPVERVQWNADGTIVVWLRTDPSDDYEKLDSLARSPQGWEVVY